MDYSRVLEYYREFLAHDDDARRVAWRTVFGQELRFEELLDSVDSEGLDIFSVLDVGCGLGDLFGYLKRTRREVDYLGVDILPEMVEEARVRHPEGHFELRDILETPPQRRFDLVVCSGSLTVKVPGHERFVLKMLRRMLDLSEMAVAVNFQSTRALRDNPMALQNDDLFHADPVKIYGLCRQMCRWTVLREDTLVTDFTIYMLPGHARTLSRYRRLPQPPPSPSGVGWLLLERRLPAQALEALDGAEVDAEVLNLRGMAYHQLGDLKVAAKLYAQALELEPDYEPARLNLETASARLND